MDKSAFKIPGFEGVDPEWIEKTLNEVHDLAQGLAYGRKGSLDGLDQNNAYYIGRALQAGENLALERLFEIMLEIRQRRTPKQNNKSNDPSSNEILPPSR